MDWLDEDDNDGDPLGRGEVAQVARVFSTLGFREGIDAGEESALQAGFNEGFCAGAKLGECAGEVESGVNVLVELLQADAERRGEQAAELQELVRLKQRVQQATARLLTSSTKAAAAHDGEASLTAATTDTTVIAIDGLAVSDTFAAADPSTDAPVKQPCSGCSCASDEHAHGGEGHGGDCCQAAETATCCQATETASCECIDRHHCRVALDDWEVLRAEWLRLQLAVTAVRPHVSES